MLRQVSQSLSYYVPSGSGYLSPDTTKRGTLYSYDGLGRVLSTTDALGGKSTNVITVACGAITGDSACYEQTLLIDPLGHQRGGLRDALGRTQYEQSFNGSVAPYSVYATTNYTYDINGNLTQIVHPNGTSTTAFAYDAVGRKKSASDPDSGAMSYQYDADGNMTQSIDARGVAGTVYAGYDGLDRPAWRSVNSDGSSPYNLFRYDQGSNGVGRLTHEDFNGAPKNALSGAYDF
ncbi:MAG: hypothetical protein E6I86_16590, partial [Chloroflexi bacterium]